MLSEEWDEIGSIERFSWCRFIQYITVTRYCSDQPGSRQRERE